MSDGISIGFADFAVVSFAVDRVRLGPKKQTSSDARAL
jgi:hypothetical protein